MGHLLKSKTKKEAKLNSQPKDKYMHHKQLISDKFLMKSKIKEILLYPRMTVWKVESIIGRNNWSIEVMIKLRWNYSPT